MLQDQEEGRAAEERAVLWKEGQGCKGSVWAVWRGLPSPKSLCTMQGGGGGGGARITTVFMSRFDPRTSYFPLKEKLIYI